MRAAVDVGQAGGKTRRGRRRVSTSDGDQESVAFEQMLVCVSITPLGSPVVPEV